LRELALSFAPAIRAAVTANPNTPVDVLLDFGDKNEFTN
jgi:hypothetical protein